MIDVFDNLKTEAGDAVHLFGRAQDPHSGYAQIA
jgi:hypothetical protein